MKRAVIAFLCAVPIAALTWGILQIAAPRWVGMRPASCMPDACFCEIAHGAHDIAQPANTLSSLGYVWAGVWMALGTWRLRWVPAAAAVVIGVGSAFFHASLTFVGQFWDVFGMHAFVAFMLAWGIARWRGNPWWHVYVPLLLVCTLILWFVPETRRWLFALLLVIAIAIEARLLRAEHIQNDPRPFAAGLAVFAVAYLIWLLDNTRVLCAPASWVQGHAVWHLLGAVASVMLHRYHVSQWNAPVIHSPPPPAR